MGKLESISLGDCPFEEDTGLDIDDPDYLEKATAQCQRYIALLRKKFGPEPKGSQFKITSNPHDFGTYLDVEIFFDESNENAVKYAFGVEHDLPGKWEE